MIKRPQVNLSCLISILIHTLNLTDKHELTRDKMCLHLSVCVGIHQLTCRSCPVSQSVEGRGERGSLW